MPKQNKILIEWLVPEYREHSRSRRWYMVAGTILVLLLTYCLLTANFLFALIIIIASIIVILQDKHAAPKIPFAITEAGIGLGKDFYDYAKLQSFWLYYEPDEAKTLFLEFKNRVRPRLAIPLFNKNPLHVREHLLEFLPEDLEKENEPVSEQLSRLLKI
ncbi:MAG: hypothetical protein AAB880_00480, partial [Patescibacteria group bacterium]